MAQPQKLGSEKFAALHAAFVGDGAFVYVPRGVFVERPIVISHGSSGATVFPHTLVIAAENSQVTVVDLFKSGSSLPDLSAETERRGQVDDIAPANAAIAPFGVAQGEIYPVGINFACGANDLYAGHGSKLTYVAVQDWSAATLSLQLNSTVVRRDARVQSLNIHLGGRQARHESLSQLQAPGAFSEMLSLTLARGSQEFDQRTLQVHQAPNTKSDLLYKNVLLGSARTIFSGLIVVDPDAQKTDAYQSNRNLMLSDDAEASSLPGLEIQANDVRCTHGATTSRIDPEQEFYLLSRGISKSRADELLMFGFFEETLSRLDNATLHEALIAIIKQRFAQNP
jgi:Fe-S cluster assembly protein SufD